MTKVLNWKKVGVGVVLAILTVSSLGAPSVEASGFRNRRFDGRFFGHRQERFQKNRFFFNKFDRFDRRPFFNRFDRFDGFNRGGFFHR